MEREKRKELYRQVMKALKPEPIKVWKKQKVARFASRLSCTLKEPHEGTMNHLATYLYKTTRVEKLGRVTYWRYLNLLKDKGFIVDKDGAISMVMPAAPESEVTNG